MSRTQKEWETRPNLPERDYVSALIYTDDEIFRVEQKRVKRRSWKFVCHESEIAEPNDYRTVDHAGVPIIVTRSEDGNVRAFVNSCSHRSAKILREPRGNARSWTCVFHHWVYNNKGDCIAIPREAGYEGGPVCKASSGLREVKAATRLGLVFVNLWDESPSFDECIGNALETVETALGSEELEVIHFHKGLVNANWKLLHEVNGMELYHETLHAINRQVAIATPGYYDRTWKIYPNGHATLDPMKQRYSRIKGWTERNDAALPGIEPGEFRLVELFPDTVILIRSTVIRIDTLTPIAPGQTIVDCRGLAIKGESAANRAMRVKHHNQYWGPFGRNYPEDCVATEFIERATHQGAGMFGLFARHEGFKAQDDEPIRAYYEQWSKMMGCSAHAPKIERPPAK